MSKPYWIDEADDRNELKQKFNFFERFLVRRLKRKLLALVINRLDEAQKRKLIEDSQRLALNSIFTRVFHEQ